RPPGGRRTVPTHRGAVDREVAHWDDERSGLKEVTRGEEVLHESRVETADATPQHEQWAPRDHVGRVDLEEAQVAHDLEHASPRRRASGRHEALCGDGKASRLRRGDAQDAIRRYSAHRMTARPWPIGAWT